MEKEPEENKNEKMVEDRAKSTEKNEVLSAEELDNIAGGGLKNIVDFSSGHGGW